MKVENLKISQVRENPANPRKVQKDKYQKLLKSIQEFPEMLPVIIRENNKK